MIALSLKEKFEAMSKLTSTVIINDRTFHAFYNQQRNSIKSLTHLKKKN